MFKSELHQFSRCSSTIARGGVHNTSTQCDKGKANNLKVQVGYSESNLKAAAGGAGTRMLLLLGTAVVTVVCIMPR
jgi:hypothetical protein